ncbi:MAG: serine/threonine protein kinase [Chloroflexi bacterium]|nr:serine/threonine protein kinase [Chloroflexota bacterium]
MHANAFVTELIEVADRHDYRDYTSTESGFQSLLERDVVIRRLRGEASTNPRTRSRFINEVKTLASLSHHNFIRVYDAGLSETVPFAVFERLRGVTVQHRLDLLADRGERLELAEVTRILQGVSDGLEHAHSRGVRIYDVTPGNIVLSDDRRVVLTGLGQPLPDNPLLASATALAYAPPEQLFGVPSGREGDVYSLGVLLAHLVFGRLPFEGTVVSVLAQKQQSASLPILEDGQATLDCPYPLAAVIHRATSAEPVERYRSIEAFRTALRDSLSGQPYRLHARPRLSPLGAPGHEDRPVQPAVALWRANTDEEEVDYITRTAPGTVVEDLAPPSAEPALAPEPVPFDPKLPGLDRPELQAALPYTLLVPLPDDAAVSAATTPRRGGVRQSFLSPVHLAVIAMLSILAIGAALMFG